MRLFEEPIIEVQKFAVEDVITTSATEFTWPEDMLPPDFKD